MFWFRWAAAFGLCMVLFCGQEAAAAEPARPLVPDPAMRRGVLPNGLRYVILPNPGVGLSLRLGFAVGSLDEAEAERGAAHFVEHMAFRSTRSFPEGEVDPAFAPLGVTVGRDQNAFTGLRTTIYHLDLPNPGASQRAIALRWLRDVADGVQFDPMAVERERGVVLAERDAGAGPDVEIAWKIDAFQGPGLRSVARPPIGDLQVLRVITPATLRAFHRRWYRPEHAVLVVVGEVPDGFEAEIAGAFGAWRGGGPAPARVAGAVVNAARGLDVLTISEPRTAEGVAICRVRPAMSLRLADEADLHRQVLQQLALDALQARLDKLTLSDPSILSATVSFEQEGLEASETCLQAGAAAGAWQAALKALRDEAGRFSAEPPDELETEAALALFRGGLLGVIAQAGSRSSADEATQLIDSELLGQVRQAPRQAMKTFNQAVEGLAPADIASAWAALWSGAGPLVTVVAPKAPDRGKVLEAWADRTAGASHAAAKKAEWAYPSPGTPGEVVSREAFSDPAFVRFRFRNGVVLNFKQTAFTKRTADVRVVFGGGRGELGGRSTQEGQLAARMFIPGGLGRHAYGELLAIGGEEAMRMALFMNNRSFSLESTVFTDHLSSQLELMAAYFTDPGFRDEADGKIASGVGNTYRANSASPDAAVVQAIRKTMVPGLRAYPPEAQMAAFGSRDAAAMLRPAVTQAPLEVTLVGDVDEKTAVELVGRSLGAMPKRDPRATPDARFERFPDPLPAPIRTSHAGAAEKAALGAVWPLFVSTVDRRREKGALEVLAAIFDNELRSGVRERLGKAYAPSVSLIAYDRADQAYLFAEVEAAPADLAAVEAEMRAITARLARGEITPQQLEAARTPLVATSAADLVTNSWLADFLADSARDRQSLIDLVEEPRVLGQLTLDDIKAAAAGWLSRPPLVVLAIPETSQ